ncbi:MAG: IS1/IS1595 family N-terminal zinc-binding domain-containing protein [Vicinamibacterales bacterium]
MTCKKCEHGTAKRFGFTKAKTARYRCRHCGATFTEPKANPLGTHTTSLDDAEKVFTLLTEGMSIRAVSRVTGIHKTTILSLLQTVGEKCENVLRSKIVDVRPAYVQADEAWTFVQKKQKRLTSDDPTERGDQYVWLGMDSDRKLIIAHHVGKRDHVNAYEFIGRLGLRIAPAHHFQITTDGLEGYIPAVEETFGSDVDFAQLVKNYAKPATDGPDWFRPSSKVISTTKVPIIGSPKASRVSTSHIERANLTVRMHLRRFTRLSNGFSKTLANLKAAVAVFVAWYNFCRVHQTLRVTPAMECGITDHVWSVRELLAA